MPSRQRGGASRVPLVDARGDRNRGPMNTRRTWVSLYWARAVGVPVRVEAFDEGDEGGGGRHGSHAPTLGGAFRISRGGWWFPVHGTGKGRGMPGPSGTATTYGPGVGPGPIRGAERVELMRDQLFFAIPPLANPSRSRTL